MDTESVREGNEILTLAARIEAVYKSEGQGEALTAMATATGALLARNSVDADHFEKGVAITARRVREVGEKFMGLNKPYISEIVSRLEGMGVKSEPPKMQPADIPHAQHILDIVEAIGKTIAQTIAEKTAAGEIDAKKNTFIATAIALGVLVSGDDYGVVKALNLAEDMVTDAVIAASSAGIKSISEFVAAGRKNAENIKGSPAPECHLQAGDLAECIAPTEELDRLRNTLAWLPELLLPKPGSVYPVYKAETIPPIYRDVGKREGFGDVAVGIEIDGKRRMFPAHWFKKSLTH